MPIQSQPYVTPLNSSDTVVLDFLNRIVAIEKLIPAPTSDGSVQFADAGPRFWDPSSGPFPRFYNRLANLAMMPQMQGQPYYPDTLTFEMRLIVGTLSSGYLGEREDVFNQMVYSTLNCFRQRPYLNDPATGAEMRYLSRGKMSSQILAEPGGLHGYTFDNQPQTMLYMGGGFLLTVNITTAVGRIS